MSFANVMMYLKIIDSGGGEKDEKKEKGGGMSFNMLMQRLKNGARRKTSI